jgi:hypothetical protein
MCVVVNATKNKPQLGVLAHVLAQTFGVCVLCQEATLRHNVVKRISLKYINQYLIARSALGGCHGPRYAWCKHPLTMCMYVTLVGIIAC